MQQEINVQNRTWYGVNATVIIGPAFLHKAGWGNLLIPHPAVVNWLLRRGLMDKARDSLSLKHEIGHFETLPLVMLYAAANVAIIFVVGQANLLKIVLTFISIHAAWEIISELFAIFSNIQYYRKCYQSLTIIPRAIFWIVTIALTLVGWIIALA